MTIVNKLNLFGCRFCALAYIEEVLSMFFPPFSSNSLLGVHIIIRGWCRKEAKGKYLSEQKDEKWLRVIINMGNGIGFRVTHRHTKIIKYRDSFISAKKLIVCFGAYWEIGVVGKWFWHTFSQPLYSVWDACITERKKWNLSAIM